MATYRPTQGKRPPVRSGQRTRQSVLVGGMQAPVDLNARPLAGMIAASSSATATLVNPRALSPLGQSRIGTALYPSATLYPATTQFPSAGTGDRRLGSPSLTAANARPLAGTVTATATVTATLVAATPTYTLLPIGVVRTAGLTPNIKLFPGPNVFPVSGAGGRGLGALDVGSASARALAGTVTITSTATGDLVAATPGSRRLGSPTVTSVGIPRPTGLVHVRAFGALNVSGRLLIVTGQVHTRAMGALKLRGTLFPTGQRHTRGLGVPSVNPRTLAPTGLHHTRATGAPVVTVVWILRPAAQRHVRTVGATQIRGQLIVGPAGLVRVRRQGVPQLSGHVITSGLVHTRRIGTPEVNVRFLAPPALSRL